MFALIALIAIVVLIGGMAMVAISVNEFTKKMETFRQVLDARYTMEPIVKEKPQSKQAEAKGNRENTLTASIDNLLRTKDSK